MQRDQSVASCNQQDAFWLYAKDDDDLTLLHVAVHSGSAACSLDIMIVHTQGIGYLVESLLSFLDKENITPLHSVVGMGYTEVVEVLMKYGTSPILMKNDQPSSLHQVVIFHF